MVLDSFDKNFYFSGFHLSFSKNLPKVLVVCIFMASSSMYWHMFQVAINNLKFCFYYELFWMFFWKYRLRPHGLVWKKNNLICVVTLKLNAKVKFKVFCYRQVFCKQPQVKIFNKKNKQKQHKIRYRTLERKKKLSGNKEFPIDLTTKFLITYLVYIHWIHNLFQYI